MSESAPRVLPASLHRPQAWKGEGFCGGRGYDQVPEGTVIFTTKNTSVVEPICLCCLSSHWVQMDPATHRWQRKQLPRHWRMQASPMMPLKLLYVQLFRTASQPPPHPQ